MSLDSTISSKIKSLRKQQQLTIERLAAKSGVSRSMISLIEREKASATASVLNNIANALNISLPQLLSTDKDKVSNGPSKSTCESQNHWRDPETGYVRKQLTPPEFESDVELTEVTFPPGQAISFENASRTIKIHQQIWMISGQLIIKTGESSWRLDKGDCFAFSQPQLVTFSNPGTVEAKYLIALVSKKSSGESYV